MSDPAAYSVRISCKPEDIARACHLRARVFRHAEPAASDADRHDANCAHILVENKKTGALAATLRAMRIPDATALRTSYSSSYYDLTPLTVPEGGYVEIGRFCADPLLASPDILRLCFAALTRLVDEAGAGGLIGCSSFVGTDPQEWAASFALLRNHRLSTDVSPRHEGADAFALLDIPFDRKTALSRMPSLLRMYVGLGGQVSSRGVIDRELGTMHLFTRLDIKRVAPERIAALRTLATSVFGPN